MSGRTPAKGYQRSSTESSPKRIISTKQLQNFFVPQKHDFVLSDNKEFPTLSRSSDQVPAYSDTGSLKYSDKLKSSFHSPVNNPSGSLLRNNSESSDFQEWKSYGSRPLPKMPNKEIPQQNKVLFKTEIGKANDSKTRYSLKSVPDCKDISPSKSVDDNVNRNHIQHYRTVPQNSTDLKSYPKYSAPTSRSCIPSVPSSDSKSSKQPKPGLISKLDGDKSDEAAKTAKKKRRKSKIKRQAAFQSGKVSLVTPEIHSKILNNVNPSSSKATQNVLTDLNNEEEYPQLGKPLINFPKNKPKEVSLSMSALENVKPQVSFKDALDAKEVILNERHELEQLNSMGKKKKSSKPVHPKDPITFTFLDVLTTKPSKPKEKEKKVEPEPAANASSSKEKPKKTSCNAPNLLDSSGPMKKRGKERENPKPKKPSHLKKIILMDRQLRKEHLLQLKANVDQDNLPNADIIEKVTETDYEATESGLCETSEEENVPVPSTSLATRAEDLLCFNPETPASEVADKDSGLEITPVIETDFGSSNNVLYEKKENELDKCFLQNRFLLAVKNSPEKEKSAKILLHTRNFREYCNHLISEDIDNAVHALLDDLARFQDRLHQKDPVKAKARRRMIYGVKEVKKYIKLKKLKCIIIATDIENVESEGGLNDILNEIKMLAVEYSTPCVFALGRKALGKVCHKPVPVSCIGVLNADGSEANLKKTIELVNISAVDYVNILNDLMLKLTEEEANLLLKARKEAPETLNDVRSTILRRLYTSSQTDSEKIPLSGNFIESNDSDSA